MDNNSTLDITTEDSADCTLMNDSCLNDFNETLNESSNKFFMKRSLSRASFRQSFRSSKSKLDIFKSPLDFGKRKRSRKEDDTMSLASVDFSIDEPQNKRRLSLAKMPSLAALLSPVAPIKKVFQKSLSSLALKGAGKSAYKDPVPTPPRRRNNVYWHETVRKEFLGRLNKTEIERQESIYEVLQSEEDLIEDMKMIQKTYESSMVTLQLMSYEELNQLFGHLTTLIPLHQQLVDELKSLRDEDNCIERVGATLANWMPRLNVYVPYCANQLQNKSLLDAKRSDSQIRDFLERCQESSFSRHLDLWSFLDVPRSRLVKYPLLIKAIQKVTSEDHTDQESLSSAVRSVEKIINDVDHATGLAKCSFIKSRLVYPKDIQKYAEIEESKMILCDGSLKTNRGTKLYVCLFDKVLVLTLPISTSCQTQYQLYKTPIPTTALCLEDLAAGGPANSLQSAAAGPANSQQSGAGPTSSQQTGAETEAAGSCSDVKRSDSNKSSKSITRHGSGNSNGGSFKRSVINNGTFRISTRNQGDDDSVSVILEANDPQDKQHWLRCVENAVSMATSSANSTHNDDLDSESLSTSSCMDTTLTARPPKLVRKPLFRSKAVLCKKRRSLLKEPTEEEPCDVITQQDECVVVDDLVVKKKIRMSTEMFDSAGNENGIINGSENVSNVSLDSIIVPPPGLNLRPAASMFNGNSVENLQRGASVEGVRPEVGGRVGCGEGMAGGMRVKHVQSYEGVTALGDEMFVNEDVVSLNDGEEEFDL